VKGDKVTRGKIVQALIDALEPLDYVYAFYEGGAAASNRVDEWSDVDLYVVVDDGKIDEAFVAVERALETLAPITQKYGVPHTGWEGIYQAFYRLENVSEYLFIDLAVVKLSSPDKLLAPEIHGDNVFYFNKDGAVKVPRLDKEAFVKKVLARLERLRARFSMFNSVCQKEINRGNFLEAVYSFRVLTFGSLVEALRIKCNPVHFDFEMRYVHHEFPPDVVERLGRLCFVRDVEDLQEKYVEATKWFNELTAEINKEEIERLIKKA
jgi:hypothetical protein